MTSLAPGERTAGFLLVLGLLVVGFGLATLGWVDYVTANDAIENAERTEVTVVETQLTEHRGEADGERSYSVTIVYEYEVDGETYRSSNVRPGVSDRSYSRRVDAEGLLQRYPEGETATGYVDPDDPERAFLERPSRGDRLENHLLNAAVTLVGLLVFAVGAVGALRSAAAIDR